MFVQKLFVTSILELLMTFKFSYTNLYKLVSKIILNATIIVIPPNGTNLLITIPIIHHAFYQLKLSIYFWYHDSAACTPSKHVRPEKTVN